MNSATSTMFKSMINIYFGIKLGCLLGTFSLTFILLYLPPAELKDVLNSECSTLSSCSLEALARVLDGRLM